MIFDNLILGPARLVKTMAETIKDRAEDQLYNLDNIRSDLMKLEQEFKNGDITEEEYEELEKNIMQRLQVAREREKQQYDE